MSRFTFSDIDKQSGRRHLDSYATRTFYNLDFSLQQIPIVAGVSVRLDEAGLIMHEGTVGDATLIAWPPIANSREEKQDPCIRLQELLQIFMLLKKSKASKRK